MKKAFTMIELIFVIVILGILAAVAIPKLNATRDDAEQAKLATNITTIMSDFATYYTSQGTFKKWVEDTSITEEAKCVSPKAWSDGKCKKPQTPDFKAVTNVALDNGVLKVKTKDCLTFEFVTADTGANAKNNYAAIKITPAAVANMDKVCKAVLAQSDIEAALTNSSGKSVVKTKSAGLITEGQEVKFNYASSGIVE